MKTRILAALICPLLLACAAHAQVVSHLVSLDPQLVFPGEVERTLQLPGFDSALGTLTGVRITIDSYAEQMARGENIGASPSTFGFNLTSQFNLRRAGQVEGIVMLSPAILIDYGNLAAFDGGYDFAGPSAFNYTLTTTADTFIYDVPAELVAGYLSLAPIDFIAMISASAYIHGSGNLITEGSNLVGGSVGITYSYTVIPEPSVYAAVAGLATLAAAALRRRRSPA